MTIPFYQLDAFTDRRFGGNPAAVMLLDHFLDDATLLAIAAENNLSETAFLVRDDSDYQLRWFTPKVEVPLCGHATLASAAVVMQRLETHRMSVTFHSASGPLTVTKAEGAYILNFPARPSVETTPPAGLAEALGVTPLAVYVNDFNYMAILAHGDIVRALRPDMAGIKALDRPGVIVTAAGEDTHDIVSRYFAPAKGIDEDPVTGAAHCMLAPYWCERLSKDTLRAYQASPRGGEMTCHLIGDRVELTGQCVFYLEGTAEY